VVSTGFTIVVGAAIIVIIAGITIVVATTMAY